MDSPPAEGYCPTLDGWRALSIVAVLVFHGTRKDSSPVFERGALGVSVFFAISGFLITKRLLDESPIGGFSFKAFYLRRAFRILPPAYLCLASLVALSFAGVIRVYLPEVVATLLFVRNMISFDAEWYTQHFWSLAVEEQFYLFWPLLLSFGPRKARPMAMVLIVANVLARALLLGHYQQENAQALMPQALKQLPFDYIMWGCWWALLLRDPATRERFRRLLSPPVWTALAVFTVAVTLGSAFLVPLWAMLFPILIVGTLLRPESWVGRFLELPFLRWIGRLSYSLYLWQQLFFVERAYPPRHPWQAFPLNALLLLAVAAASYYALERPMIALGRKLARSRPAGAPSAEPG